MNDMQEVAKIISLMERMDRPMHYMDALIHEEVKGDDINVGVLNEIGDTRRGQYMLGKLWRKKYNDAYGSSDVENRDEEAYNAAKSVQDYAYRNNRKSGDGRAAFNAGSDAYWNNRFRASDLANRGKTKRKSEGEIFQSLADKDSKENMMNDKEVYEYALNWLKTNEDAIMRYKGDAYCKNTIQRRGCSNLGEYIILCGNNGSVPGWAFYHHYADKIYKELNLFHDGGTASSDNAGFGRAWDEFCEYVYDTRKHMGS